MFSYGHKMRFAKLFDDDELSRTMNRTHNRTHHQALVFYWNSMFYEGTNIEMVASSSFFFFCTKVWQNSALIQFAISIALLLTLLPFHVQHFSFFFFFHLLACLQHFLLKERTFSIT